ncbi:MAG: hypothetical protein K9N09_06835 [Candidatus Cloacimonetes bacterium]|nr:hypothetical protein [Candidatus Cloacimonadota bacterium]MCF7814983.1 hypothetical protein [Candidatus Cloacimonadota bacterium]MCF7868399.1 hypothetical protein [Candidatus Cloacimonadota bacterium]MCF7883872.1 hypothetical protein [Candidatus Cloacimonadota bacterium]
MAIPFVPEGADLTEEILQKQEEKFMTILDELMEKAVEFNVTMRVIGSIAFRIKAPEYKHIQYQNQRYLTDVDFVTYSKHITRVQDMFFSLGWTENQNVLRLFGDKRRIFYHPKEDIHSDIFIDKLRFCHPINFKKRLELDYPTISLIDLLLEKLQIVEINKKDLVDVMLLIRKFPISHQPQKDSINIEHLAKICAKNWGWWKTATINLDKVLDFSASYLEEDDAKIVDERINTIIDAIQNKRKTISWSLRNLIGEKMKWYNEVEEVQRD